MPVCSIATNLGKVGLSLENKTHIESSRVGTEMFIEATLNVNFAKGRQQHFDPSSCTSRLRDGATHHTIVL